MRGAPDVPTVVGLPYGIIPACAGSTQRRIAERPSVWDHPRMCGEHMVNIRSTGCLTGSSPHVRGALAKLQVVQHRVGIIPACAGSTSSAGRSSSPMGDHPRMCGEHRPLDGSVGQSTGSSPHVRGALGNVDVDDAVCGIIPACAGSTGHVAIGRPGEWDHPRMCGEHVESRYGFTCETGSSPHVRGAPQASL